MACNFFAAAEFIFTAGVPVTKDCESATDLSPKWITQ